MERSTLDFLFGSLGGLWMHNVAKKCFSDGKQGGEFHFSLGSKKKLIPVWLGLIECLGHTRGC